MTKKTASEIDHLLSFLNTSPTAWHAVSNSIKELKQQGFIELNESDSWSLKAGKKYFVTRNGSSLCSFIVPQKKPTTLKIVASHTDSPAFKLKPNAEFIKENMLMLGVEIYGAPMIASWLNRDLGIAGRVIFENKNGAIQEELVNMVSCPVVIPQLAIHLDRNVNEAGPTLNKQEQLAALAGLTTDKKKLGFLERQLKKAFAYQEILGSDLYLYPLEKAQLFGEEKELISSYRIDNLASAHACLHAIQQEYKASNETIKMAVFWDNEEIGSNTAQSAGSPFLAHVIERIMLAVDMSREDYFKILNNSLCLSIDLAHAMHPNYSDKHEPRHIMLLNQGIAIKNNAQNRYATDARSSAAIIQLCRKNKIAFQQYVARGDIACGSTVGPIVAHTNGIATVDIGCVQLSMHSSRELMGVDDHISMCKLLTAFFA